ncbi:membrane protein [Megasphaera cerevisiae DSM 20462]|jgi:uncharacterized membrane protein YdjX (TVP38/TMEM64 family)|uniref:TVP38/TMEM64 family membrane protein n=1 Tax=Megasphaera cerevisiae DSM 20462 TaxID=1122219 RepID=A0A0J6WS78_9FIRM|nr:VTT domain-containing protein [Megasphaera cerevisiae]KMO85374.1 membrane protein [Megasphaera cerevisiae DSM 20462]OKY53512.1 hypothetical protein BSR42_06940 [Megasphaera cerevisiae]SKA24949.1 Uncharacterized membrane protein YdjX, TVP38/TMEM64 family, SNARE-associated domain [Megasphaera cerevisiae DSM 20462]
MKHSTWEKWFQWAIAAGIAGILGMIHIFIPDFYSTVLRLTLDGNIDGLTTYVSSFGYGAVAISVFMIVLTNMTGLPSIPFLTVNGVIFGLGPGILISWFGEVIGIEIGFVIMRTFLRNKAQKLIERNHLLGKLDTYSTVKNMMISRAVPYSPNVVFTALAAMSRISFRKHTMATLIGKVPAVVVEVWLGHDLLKWSKHGTRFLIWVGIVVTMYCCYHQYRKHKK